MAKHTFDYDIIIDLPDLQIGETVLKRRATFETLIYNKKARSLSISWKILYHAKNEDGTYGDLIDILGIEPYYREQVAGQKSWVNLATREVLLQEPEPQSMEYTIEFDFYNMVAETQQVNIHDLIRQSAIQNMYKLTNEH